MSKISDEFEKSISAPHDAAFKAAFHKRELAKHFFRHYFPEEIVERIDFSHLEIRNQSYVDEKLRDKHSDIVYQTRIRGKTPFLYLLFEHQSTPDYWMVFRLLCYMTNLWREFMEQNPNAKQLPVVLPAVLYRGKKPWNAPRNLFEIVEDDDSLKKYTPHFTYDLYDLGSYADERLLLGESMTLGIVLYLMKHIFDQDYVDRLFQAIEYLGKVEDKNVQLEFLEWMLRYSYHARDDDREYIDRALEALDNQNARRMAMTIAERLRQEGKAIGCYTLLLSLLEERFMEIPDQFKAKLKGADIDTLNRFGRHLFRWNTLAEAEQWWEEKAPKNDA